MTIFYNYFTLTKSFPSPTSSLKLLCLNYNWLET